LQEQSRNDTGWQHLAPVRCRRLGRADEAARGRSGKRREYYPTPPRARTAQGGYGLVRWLLW